MIAGEGCPPEPSRSDASAGHSPLNELRLAGHESNQALTPIDDPAALNNLRLGMLRAPYRDIERFLDSNGLPWRSDFWGSM
jgi:hypothetical protein